MSYCRWSSDNFKCDIYMYEGSDGYHIHVASLRYVGEVPELAPKEDIDAFQESYQKQAVWMETAERAPIGLRADGEAFVYTDLKDCLSKLKELKEMGYLVPDWVIRNVQDEINYGEEI